MLPPADPLKASPFNLDAPELLRLQSQVLDRVVMEQRSTLEDRWDSAIWLGGACCCQFYKKKGCRQVSRLMLSCWGLMQPGKPSEQQ